MKKRHSNEQSGETTEQSGESSPDRLPARIHGLVTGLLVGLSDTSESLVTFPGSPSSEAVRARSIVVLQSADVGRQVALLFDGGDPCLPVVVGTVQSKLTAETNELAPWRIRLDGEEVQVLARNRLTLQCGKASITLTESGKIILRGEYVSSHSSGVNRIKGGSVQIN